MSRWQSVAKNFKNQKSKPSTIKEDRPEEPKRVTGELLPPIGSSETGKLFDLLEAEHWQQSVRSHVYSLGQIVACLTLLLQCRASLRGAADSMALMSRLLGEGDRSPSPTTVRTWILRVGLYQLNVSLTKADDWVWIVDHSVQIGQLKAMLIVGLRLSDWHQLEEKTLAYDDVELVALDPVRTSTGEVVDEQLEKAIARTGLPRLIISDDGRDLHKGLRLFRERHPAVDWIYDVKHKTAALLKRELERDEQWIEFAKAANATKRAVYQTELAFSNPPAQRGKARYMSVDILVVWGAKILKLLDRPRPENDSLDLRRLREKLGWVVRYREAIDGWQAAMTVIEVVETTVRHQGYHAQTRSKIESELPAASPGSLADRLRVELLEFVDTNSVLADEDEQLPGSSEVLESIFGKYKNLQGEAGQFGVTAMVLSIGALIGRVTIQTVRCALESITAANVKSWEQGNLGQTVGSQRIAAFGSRKDGAKPGTAKINAPALE